MFIPDFPDLRRSKGISLIELVIFIVIVSVALAGILSVMNVTNRASADPMLRKQALAIAESLLEEIELQPFTYCDPSDPATETATSSAMCTTPQGIVPTAGETRYVAPQFNNVGDYGGFTMTPIRDINNTAIPGLAGYTATVTITQVGSTLTPALPNTDVLQIDVRVQSGTTDITLTGYRFRYAPNTGP
jgi:MSHA pilin protein MshD